MAIMCYRLIKRVFATLETAEEFQTRQGEELNLIKDFGIVAGKSLKLIRELEQVVIDNNCKRVLVSDERKSGKDDL